MVSIVNQALFGVPGDAHYVVAIGAPGLSVWSYQFHANTDALFTFILTEEVSKSGSAPVSRIFGSSVDVNGIGIVPTKSGDIFTHTAMLTAGQDYTVDFRFGIDLSATNGSAVANLSDFGSWSISDVPTDPGSGGPGGSVPEPGTWMLMLAGFGLVGTMVRARSRVRCALKAPQAAL
ncbi:PEPxxWA-CTERM sorting domain-containing protein [Sphingomonas nostoxanthinifaciens]|nr:PEPxxWA-CTERM sorting domain-containing protein [Sphingomonas nostoxanthinifaciens]